MILSSRGIYTTSILTHLQEWEGHDFRRAAKTVQVTALAAEERPLIHPDTNLFPGTIYRSGMSIAFLIPIRFVIKTSGAAEPSSAM